MTDRTPKNPRLFDAQAEAAASDTPQQKHRAGNDISDLSCDQLEVLRLVMEGKSIFFTGAAGTGKSHLLRWITKALKTRYEPEDVAVTSSTGVSAVALGGRTLHSWAGIGHGKGTVPALIKQVSMNEYVATRWRKARVLVIDEISMIGGDILTKLDLIGRAVRRSAKPFGDLQVVACGDFYQLPPVEGGFCFKTDAWTETFTTTRILITPHRQASDTPFLKMLDELREGLLSAESKALLRERVKPAKILDGCGAPRLMPHLEEVRRLNAVRLAELKGQERKYVIVKGRCKSDAKFESLCDGCPASEDLRLKIGARVMLIVNLCIDDELCNGSTGTVVDFELQEDSGSSEVVPIVRFDRGAMRRICRFNWKLTDEHDIVLASLTQIPLILAWAVSIHKSQGATLDAAAVDVAGCFATGQAYVALSRTRTLDGLLINAVPTDRDMRPDPGVVKFYEALQRCSTT